MSLCSSKGPLLETPILPPAWGSPLWWRTRLTVGQVLILLAPCATGAAVLGPAFIDLRRPSSVPDFALQSFGAALGCAPRPGPAPGKPGGMSAWGHISPRSVHYRTVLQRDNFCLPPALHGCGHPGSRCLEKEEPSLPPPAPSVAKGILKFRNT